MAKKGLNVAVIKRNCNRIDEQLILVNKTLKNLRNDVTRMDGAWAGIRKDEWYKNMNLYLSELPGIIKTLNLQTQNIRKSFVNNFESEAYGSGGGSAAVSAISTGGSGSSGNSGSGGTPAGNNGTPPRDMYTGLTAVDGDGVAINNVENKTQEQIKAEIINNNNGYTLTNNDGSYTYE